ncbi:MAG: CPBP family intramembrane glutamic endopeptidase, partial [Promethearchaeota archaeon]
ILNHQLKNSSQNTSFILNGILFGLFHLVNLLFGIHLFSQIFLGIILQVIYASCLGISFAYIYTKTRSLLPCILGHYLFNTFGQIFTNGVFPNILNESLYQIFGIGIFPMIITLLITYLIFRRRRLETQNL